MAEREAWRPSRDEFPWRWSATTRWRDGDVYGHMNNVVYMEYFDTSVGLWQRETGALDVPGGPVIGVAAEVSCRYFAEIGFLARIETGVGVERIGRTSVIYRLALFAGDDLAAATCRFVHVYVDRETRRPVPLPESLRTGLDQLPMF